jgi:glucosylceramidase
MRAGQQPGTGLLRWLLFLILMGLCNEDLLLGAGELTALWRTDPHGTARLERQIVQSLNGVRVLEGSPVIAIDPDRRLQPIEGFGYTLTGGSAQLLMAMTPPARSALLRHLFGTGPDDIGISMLRLTVGASDLNDRVFTYDDMPEGRIDPRLEHFDLGPDRQDVLPVLREILAIRSDLVLMASPWTAPAWMKSNRHSKGGSLLPAWYPVYARYLVQYLKAMREEGFPVGMLTVQNEPLNPDNNPSMFMSAEDQRVFIRDHLGPAIRASGLGTKILCYDHNADRPDYPLAILDDPNAKRFVHGSAFHLYGGRIEDIQQVLRAHPDRALYFTEQWIGAPGDFAGDLGWHVAEVMVGAIRNGCRTVLEWNLAADPHQRPHTDQGGCDRCLGALTLDGDRVVRNTAYYIIAHASKFVPPGSRHVASTASVSLPNVAFVTPRRNLVLLMLNRTDHAQSFRVEAPDRRFSVTLDRGSVATLVLPAR